MTLKSSFPSPPLPSDAPNPISEAGTAGVLAHASVDEDSAVAELPVPTSLPGASKAFPTAPEESGSVSEEVKQECEASSGYFRLDDCQTKPKLVYTEDVSGLHDIDTPPPPSAKLSGDLHHVDVDLGPLKSVSRNHAKIEYRSDLGQFCLEIYGRNGVWVDDRYYIRGSVVPLNQGYVCHFINPLVDLPPALRYRSQPGSSPSFSHLPPFPRRLTRITLPTEPLTTPEILSTTFHTPTTCHQPKLGIKNFMANPVLDPAQWLHVFLLRSVPSLLPMDRG